MTPSPSRRGSVLVVDDDPDILAYYREVLEQAGYGVDTAQSVAEAEQTIAVQQPDVLVLDIAMPECDGLTLAERLHESETLRGIPVLIVTALQSFGGRHLLMELDNIRLVLFKPFPADTLVTGVDDAIRWKA